MQLTACEPSADFRFLRQPELKCSASRPHEAKFAILKYEKRLMRRVVIRFGGRDLPMAINWSDSLVTCHQWGEPKVGDITQKIKRTNYSRN